MNVHEANMRLTELKLAREAAGKGIDVDQVDISVQEDGEELYAFPAGITPTNFDSSVVRDMLLNYPSTAMH